MDIKVLTTLFKLMSSDMGKAFMKSATSSDDKNGNLDGLKNLLKQVTGSNVSDKDAAQYQELLNSMTETEKKQRSENLKDINDIAMAEPWEYIAHGVKSAAVNGSRAVGDIAENNAARLAEALLTSRRESPLTANMYNRAKEKTAYDILRKAGNTGILTNAIADTIDDTYGKIERDKNFSRHMQLSQVAPLNTGMANMYNGEMSRDYKLSKANDRATKAAKRSK